MRSKNLDATSTICGQPSEFPDERRLVDPDDVAVRDQRGGQSRQLELRLGRMLRPIPGRSGTNV